MPTMRSNLLQRLIRRPSANLIGMPSDCLSLHAVLLRNFPHRPTSMKGLTNRPLLLRTQRIECGQLHQLSRIHPRARIPTPTMGNPTRILAIHPTNNPTSNPTNLAPLGPRIHCKHLNRIATVSPPLVAALNEATKTIPSPSYHFQTSLASSQYLLCAFRLLFSMSVTTL